MSETLIPTPPALSLSFDRARKLSRAMAVLFSIGFWVTLVLLSAIPLVVVWQESLQIGANGILISLAGLSALQKTGAVFALLLNGVPILLLMHHTRRVFGHFTKSEVFMAAPIAHMRAAGIWMIASVFFSLVIQILLTVAHITPPSQIDLPLWPLFAGIATSVAAHVMTEAARIAADHAEIV
jgi:hypothetical protein